MPQQYAIDTNIMMRYILQDDEQQYEQVLQLIHHLIAKNSVADVSSIVCTEIEYLLRKLASCEKEEVITIFKALMNKAYFHFDEEAIRAVEIYKDVNTDFSDILIGEYGRTGEKLTISFDKKSCSRLDTFITLESVKL